MKIYKEKIRKAKTKMTVACEQVVFELLMKHEDEIAGIHRNHVDEIERIRRQHFDDIERLRREQVDDNERIRRAHFDAIEQLRAEKDSACRERDNLQREQRIAVIKLELENSNKNVLMIEKASLIKKIRMMENL